MDHPIKPAENFDDYPCIVEIGENDTENPLAKELGQRLQQLGLFSDEQIEEKTSQLLTLSDSVCCIVKSNELSLHTENANQGAEQYLLETKKFSDYYEVTDPIQAFFDEPCFEEGSASGFLIAEDLIATAYHVIMDKTYQELSKLRFIFGYKHKDTTNKHGITLSKDDIYKLDLDYLQRRSGIVARGDYKDWKNDWCILKLDHTRTTSRPFRIDPSSNIRINDSLMMLGHPFGIPQKISLKGEVTNFVDHVYHCSLDSFSGNSGSPVVCKSTMNVIGIFTRGEYDIHYQTITDESNLYPKSEDTAETKLKRVITYKGTHNTIREADAENSQQTFISTQPLSDFLPSKANSAPPEPSID